MFSNFLLIASEYPPQNSDVKYDISSRHSDNTKFHDIKPQVKLYVILGFHVWKFELPLRL
jgi:hypothetical protein